MDASRVDFAALRDYVLFSFTIIAGAFTSGIIWGKLNDRINTNIDVIKTKADQSELNGLGGRVDAIEADCSTRDGRMDGIEKAVVEYRRDAQDAANKAARIEKSIEGMHSEIQNNHLAIGTQLNDIIKLIAKTDKETSNRLVRIETVQKLAAKIEPLPTDL